MTIYLKPVRPSNFRKKHSVCPIFPAHGSSWRSTGISWHQAKYQFIENTYLPLRRIFKHYFDMQKTYIFPNRRTVSQTGKIIPAVSKPTGLRYDSHRRLNVVLQTETVIPAKVNRANSKVNKTIIQSACGFHLHRQMASCVLSTSKRFQYLKTTAPRCFGQGGKPRSEVVRFKIFDRFTKKQYVTDFPPHK
jgi:hypothetical protein